ncbi:MAG: hypothetical protein ACRELU_00375 [Gemmatimonadota bacterium]
MRSSSSVFAASSREPVIVNGLLIHMLRVGLPSALFASAVRESTHA